ncbi:ATP-dependent DNA ligase [Candidatus Bathyarchaeota archaeon]|nr:ATP-dependent DNA ligase [Candidatus Bathyarchaeota archaeon]
MEFSRVADLYEKIEDTTKRLEMTDHLVSLFKDSPPQMIDKVIYLTQGKLYPDYMGIELGMAERMAIEAVSRATLVAKKKINQLYKQYGDLGSTVEDLLKGRFPPLKALTVEDVYSTLDKIAKTSGKGSNEIKIRLLSKLLRESRPKEAKYIVRIVTGKLRLGIGDMTILDALALAFTGDKSNRLILEEAYNLSSDLGIVAKTIAEKGLEGIKKFQVTIGRPIRPMLAERMASVEEILERMNGKASVEFKYDGLRIQAHISPKEVYLFSRRMENITTQFPDVAEALRKSLKVDEAIVEGECVAVDPHTGEMYPFQMISRRRGRKYDIEKMMEEIPVNIYLFDVLYLNGVDMTKKPYLERRSTLEKIVEESDKVKLAEYRIIDNPKDLELYMHIAIEKGCEGVMVKSIDEDSIYTAGKRGFKWLKYKREYKSEMGDTVDLVVVGAFAGRGKRAGTYGALLMAAYNHERDMFETVCKLGTGFTDEELARLPEILKPYKLEHCHPRVDSAIKADVWFVPAIVLEVRGAELTLSPSHRCGWGKVAENAGLAIRFPRLEKWRTDKSPEDATTVKEIIEMYRNQLKHI